MEHGDRRRLDRDRLSCWRERDRETERRGLEIGENHSKSMMHHKHSWKIKIQP
jgi:hypothetical protein